MIALNEAAAKSLGKPMESLINSNPTELFPCNVMETRIAYLKKSVQTKKIMSVIDERDGRIFRTLYYPISAETGAIYRVAVCANDITQSVIAERQIKESEEKYRNIVDLAPDGILVLDADEKVISCNSAFTNIIELSAEDIIGKQFSELPIKLPKEMPGLSKLCRSISSEKSPNIIICKSQPKFDCNKFLDIRCSVIKKQNKISGFQVILRDVTEQIKASEERDRLMLKLARTEKMVTLGQLSISIAHEINNPLDIITSKLYLLKTEAADLNVDKSLMGYFEDISHQIKRLSSLAGDILNYAWPLTINLKPINLYQIIQRVIDLFRFQFTDFVEWTIKLDQKKLFINGDEIGLELVFKNLILNAIQACEKSAKITIESIAKTNNMIGIKIRDNGVGIPAENIDKLFEAFFTTRRETGGTGLGLPICQKIIQQHKGLIKISSKKNRGTVVSLLLPNNSKQ